MQPDRSILPKTTLGVPLLPLFAVALPLTGPNGKQPVGDCGLLDDRQCIADAAIVGKIRHDITGDSVLIFERPEEKAS